MANFKKTLAVAPIFLAFLFAGHSYSAKEADSQGYLGVRLMSVPQMLAVHLGLDENEGQMVINVVKDSPADKAGLRGGYKVEIIDNTPVRLGGDVIVNIDGMEVSNVTDISNYIANKKVGDVVDLTIIRDGKRLNTSATLEILPEMNGSEQLQIQPFPDTDSDQFNKYGQGKHMEELKKACIRNFNEDICNFLFR